MVFSDWFCWMEGVSKIFNTRPCERIDHLSEWEPSTGSFKRNQMDGRSYWTYRPSPLGRGSPRGLVVLLHGCCQYPTDFAYTSNMIPVAEQENLVLLFPDQSEASNPRRCWNWFRPGHRERNGGEPSLIAKMVRRVREVHRIPPERCFLAGFSAGAAMVPVMVSTHPQLFGAAAMHSGLEYGAADGVTEAFRAMSCGGPDPEKKAGEMLQSIRAHHQGNPDPIPVMILHGTEDDTVSIQNVSQIVSQMVRVNLELVQGRGEEPRVDQSVKRPGDRRSYREILFSDEELGALVKAVVIEGLGHNWSGGPSGAPYSDPEGPDAARLIWDFFDSCPLPAGETFKAA